MASMLMWARADDPEPVAKRDFATSNIAKEKNNVVLVEYHM